MCKVRLSPFILSEAFVGTLPRCFSWGKWHISFTDRWRICGLTGKIKLKLLCFPAQLLQVSSQPHLSECTKLCAAEELFSKCLWRLVFTFFLRESQSKRWIESAWQRERERERRREKGSDCQNERKMDRDRGEVGFLQSPRDVRI